MRGIIGRFDRGERVRLGLAAGAILLMHVFGWGVVLTVGAGNPALLGLAGLAYALGLRHAFDADHISAIDNTTRKLLQQGKKPVSVGFFFSLGHSTVVLLIAVALGLAIRAVVQGVIGEGGELKSIGGLIGLAVSGGFLLLIGTLNLFILLDILATFRRMKRGEYDQVSLEQQLVSGGVLTRLFARLFKIVTASWHMYPIGFLFGLGFDTASEVALLAVSAGAAAQGLPFIVILALPVVFAAGMSLMDTMDGVFMAKAYAWAFSSPVRKLFYNLTMTGLSVFVALFIGGIELLQLLVDLLKLHGGPFDIMANINLGAIGFIIVAAFILCWVVAFVVYRLRRVEERWTALIDRKSQAGR